VRQDHRGRRLYLGRHRLGPRRQPHPRPQGGRRHRLRRRRLHRLWGVCRRLPQRGRQPVHRRQGRPPQPAASGPGGAVAAHRGDGGDDGAVLRVLHQPRRVREGLPEGHLHRLHRHDEPGLRQGEGEEPAPPQPEQLSPGATRSTHSFLVGAPPTFLRPPSFLLSWPWIKEGSMATTAERAPTIYHHPRAEGGLSSWLTTVDHKRIGVMYGYTAFTFFLIGGLEALLLRIHLAQANSEFLTAGAYNALFTMHGTTMIFLVVMPLASAFMNYLLPLQLGARDVAFPRLNALSFWIFLFGGIFLYSTFLFGSALPPSYPGGAAVGNMPINGGPGGFDFLASAPNGGWFGYQPHAGPDFSQGTVLAYWAFGLQILGLASLISAVNFIVTVFNMRAKGMRLLRMPVFCWTTLVTAFLLLFSLPIIAVALF